MKRIRKDAFTEEHIEYIREIAKDRSNNEIKEMLNKKFNLNRTENSITTIKSKNGIYSYTRLYTKEHLEYLRKISPGKSHRQITELFNKKFNQDRTESSIKSIMGEKGILLTNNGKFKKGNKPKNTLPVGTETMRDGEYLYVKIAEPNKWKQKHRIIWEEHNGPIPADHAILFGDGNTLNFDIDNLILVSKAQVLKLNQFDLIQNDIELTKTGLIIADMHLKIGKVKKSKEDSHD